MKKEFKKSLRKKFMKKQFMKKEYGQMVKEIEKETALKTRSGRVIKPPQKMNL